MSIIVVLPAYNEEKTIAKVMKHLLSWDVGLVVVDDGSSDDTKVEAENIKKRFPDRVKIYRHSINLGVGAATRTGIEAALSENPDIIVTIDADGQHHPEDLMKVIDPIKKGKADVVNGRRDFQKMPRSKRWGNQIMNAITLIFYGIRVEDSQSGFRAFNRKAAKLIKLYNRDYGFSSEMMGEVRKHHLRLVEVPIKTIYTDYSLSKGTNTMVGLKILAKLFRNVLK